jgi:transcriptional regulator with XRE-family HTH domain
MKDINSNIGKNLKNIRLQRNLTLDQLSRDSGISKSMISEIERGIRNPSITTIWSLANCLKKPLNYFLTGVHKDGPKIYKINEKNSISGEGFTFNPLMDYDEEKKFELYFNEYDPSCVTEESVHYQGVEEFVLVARGRLTLHIEGKEYSAGEGDIFHFKGDRKHHFSNPGDEPARAFTIMFYGK